MISYVGLLEVILRLFDHMILDNTPEAFVGIILKGLMRDLKEALFQSKHAKDPKHIRKSTIEHLWHLSNQIDIVEEICMSISEDGYLRKPTQWVRKASYLKSQVSDALEEHKTSKYPSSKNKDLERMCDEIFNYMKECPVEDVNDKPLAFIIRMHETHDGNLQIEDEENEGSSYHASDTSKTEDDNVPKVIGEDRAPSSNITHITGKKSKDHGKCITRHTQALLFNPTHDDESQIDRIIPILVTGTLSKYVDLRLEILSMPPSDGTSTFNSQFGLSPEKDKYLLSDAKRLETFDVSSTSMLEYIFVNRSGSKSKEMPTIDEWRHASVVNLTDKTLSLPSEPYCPNLELLFLQRNGRLTDIPSTFFNKMPALRFLDLSDTRIKVLPSALFKLKELRVLLLRSCACLDSLPDNIQNLKNMEVLDLLGTDLYLPKEIGELQFLRHLQLSLNQPDYASDYAKFEPKLVWSGAISKLKALQALSIEVHPKDHHYWITIVREIILHVGELMMLSYLKFYFPTIEDLNCFIDISLWKKKRLKRFNFIVGRNINRIISRVPDEVELEYDQYDRCLRFVNGSEVPEVMKSILKRVTALYLDHHSNIHSLSEFGISNFKELKFCVLRECCNMQFMINKTKDEIAFANLEYLGLHYLWELKQIWEDLIPQGSFQALKYMQVSTCGQLKYIGSHSILQCLSNLETFIIDDCESLTSIVNMKENEMVKYDVHLLPRLKKLVLRHLPQLVALGNGLFPPEEIMQIQFCPNLILGPRHNMIEWKKVLSSSYNCCNIYSSSNT